MVLQVRVQVVGGCFIRSDGWEGLRAKERPRCGWYYKLEQDRQCIAKAYGMGKGLEEEAKHVIDCCYPRSTIVFASNY
jgi:hypothetical protein